MVIGVLGAIAQMDFKRLLAFHIVSQIGYMILGLAVMSAAGLAGGLMHIMFNMVIKPALFLIAGATEEVHRHHGSAKDERRSFTTRRPSRSSSSWADWAWPGCRL